MQGRPLVSVCIGRLTLPKRPEMLMFSVQDWPLSLPLDGYRGAFFDLDGTLVDTMPLHGRAYIRAFAAMGHVLTLDDYLRHIGPPARIAIRSFARAAGMDGIDDAAVAAIHAAKKRHFHDVLAEDAAMPLPASDLLRRLAGAMPLALVSSGNRDGVTAILAGMGWTGMFGHVVTGDDVARGKPAPDPYLMAAEALAVAPGTAVAFEDTEAGWVSARAAGMTVVDVTTPGRVLRAGDGASTGATAT
jgi:beta-phosphoglucomutase